MSEFKKYFNEKFFDKTIFKEKGENIDGLLSNEMSVICGDFYGIQKFIFEGLTTKHAAKVLRAKSAFVDIFTRVVAEFLCKKLKGKSLSTNAGKFEILVNSIVENKQIDEIQKELDNYFIKNFYGISGMSIVSVNCKKGDFEPGEPYKALRDKIQKAVETKKFSKFDLGKMDANVLDYNKDITNQTLCPICNMRKISDGENCKFCSMFKNLGSWLVGNKDEVSAKELNIDFCGDITIKLDEKIKSYVAKNNHEIMSFEELAKIDKDSTTPLNALGVLKADVDGMGNFIKGSDITNCFSSFDLFSKNIDAFFSLYITKIIEKEFPNTYVVFAGGDDLFVIGEWKSALNLARKIKTEFENFVKDKETKDLSISFGVAIAKHSTPVKYLADITEELLEKSKSLDGKNAISMFNLSVKWVNYLNTLEKLEKLKKLGGDDKTAFFYRLLDLCDMSARIQNGNFTPKDSMWRSKLHYSIERNIKDSDKKELLELLNTQIEQYPKESKMVISEIIYTRREK